MSQYNTQGVDGLVAESRAKAPKGDLDRLLQADAVVKHCDPRVLEAMGVLERAVHLADSYAALDAMIDDKTLSRLMRLMNTPLGFMCDKPSYKSNEVYSPAIVKRCIIEGLLYGVMPIGNEFNIIADRCYVTRCGYTRKLNEFPGLTDLRIDYGVPKTIQRPTDEMPSGALVVCKASWRINGVSDSMEAEIPVKMNKSMGLDAVIGKADRKVKHRVWCRITGSTFTPEGELDEDDAAPVAATKATTTAPTVAAKVEQLRTEAVKKTEAAKAPAPKQPEPIKDDLDFLGDTPFEPTT